MGLRNFFARLGTFGKRDVIDAELAEEMAEHLRMVEEQNAADGMTPREAREAARRAFGNPTLARERSCEVWRFDSFDAWTADVRFGVRVLRKHWVSTLVAMLALGVGIGATTAAVSALDAIYHRRFTYSHPDRLALLWAASTRDRRVWSAAMPAAELRAWRDEAHGVSIGAFGLARNANVVVANAPTRAAAISFSANLLPLLGVQPIIGRAFTLDDERDEAPNAAMVSYPFWSRVLGGDSSAVGRTITIDRQSYMLIGVLPELFEVPAWGEVPIILPIRATQWNDRVLRNTQGIARLAPGVTLESLRAELEPIMKHFDDETPDQRGKWTPSVRTLASFGTWSAAPVEAFLGLGWMVLLIACANVAILLLARIPAREHELAIRLALGSGRRRLVRQFALENALLVGAGGAIGVAAARIAAKYFDQIVRGSSGLALRPSLLTLPVVCGIGAVLATCMMFGLAPVADVLRRLPGHHGILMSGRRGSSTVAQGRLRSTLIAVEVALSVVLLTAGLLMVTSLLRMRNRALGFDTDGFISARIQLDSTRYHDVAARRVFFADLMSRLGAHDDLRNATAGTMVPFAEAGWSANDVARRSSDGVRVDTIMVYTITVMPNYFAAMKLPLTAGASFSSANAVGQVVVNENLARTMWPGQSAIGRRLEMLNPLTGEVVDAARGSRIVVGVVKDPPMAPSSPMAKTIAVAYVSYAENPATAMYVAVHAHSVAAGMRVLREEVGALDPDLPLFAVSSIDDVMDSWLFALEKEEWVGTCLALVGLLLTIVGIYSVVAVLVSQRTHELGIRLAIGAQAADVISIVMRGTLVAAAVGVVFGVVAGWLSRNIVGVFLYETSSAEPGAFVAGIAVILICVLLGAFVPARRAATLDPIIALRAE